MFRIKKLILILCLAAFPGVASALDSVEITLAQGSLNHHIWGAPSPTPGYCYWEHSTAETQYHATQEDGYGNMDCPHPWFAHCDSDSLSFIGTWPFIDSEYVTGAEYYADLSCRVTILDETLAVATRQITGDLDTDQHTLVVEFSDGSDLVLLAEDGGPDLAEITMPPGEYVFHLHVHAYQHKSFGSNIYPYRGQVRLHFQEPGPVANPPLTWDALKTYFR